jgi:hypothetical protein
VCALVRHGTAGGTQTLQSSPRRVLSSSSPREAPPARPSPPNACRQTTRRASEVRRDRARASPRPATATTGAFCSIGDEAGERMVARATDHRRRARSRSSRASSLTSSSQTENRDLNKRTAESEASPPSARPATAPYRPSHGFCRPRGTSKPCRVGGVHYLSVRWTLVRNSCLRSTAWRRVSSRAATNCGRTAISSVLATLISMPLPPAVRSQPL